MAARRSARAALVSSWALIASLTAATAWPLAAHALESAPTDDPNPDTESLRRELQQEKARIQALEQRLAADEAVRSAASATPTATSPNAAAANGAPNPKILVGNFGRQGFTLQTLDGANQVHFRGNVSVDDRYFSDSGTPTTADSWLIRKLRPTLEGTLEDIYDFRFMPDFGLGKAIVQDAWADARVEPWLVFTFGKLKAPVGLERLQLEQFARFIEPALTADLVPYRDLGGQIGGTLGGGLLSYAVGEFDGAVDGGSTEGNSVPDANSTGKFCWHGRLYSKPFVQTDWSVLKGFGFGVAASYVNWKGVASATTTTSLLASYKTTGQQSMFSYRGNTATGAAINNATIADGIERRVVPQFYYAYRIVSLLGEYVREDQQVRRELSATTASTATLHHTAEQLQLAVFLTGEDEAFDSTTPRRDFGYGKGGAGAWEWVARYHALHFDRAAFEGGAASFANPASAPLAAHAWGTGVNWYLNANFKIQLDYELTRFDGGATKGDRPDERVLTSQFALIF
ncbi:MAG: OprO/OprP family phosphate-selective porin [Steroidobacterales bacterium]